ncbi:protein C6orf166, putative [Pediculus humanus corporis]|uniref:Protein C6orf166, putative n=1 Tax=Pediculus humanus subsp. corporis TaxID=121224 RepID=E0VR52_PEDHC|nr:protein C6orf166, putative [Pediculus humanus corporis]EEB15858.1 protein C6orf166, putative [Pediculus humanus corporis]
MACATLKRSWEFDPVHSPGRPNKRPRCTPMCVSPTSSSPPPAKKSIFDAPKMTPDEMAASIRHEIERLKRKGHRNIDHGASMSMSPTPSEGSNSDSEGMPMSPEYSQNDGSLNLINNIKKDTLFTYKQVHQICSRIVREREDQLRQEYDEILNSKLSEQYDTFLKFSRDQIQRHFSPDNTPSFEISMS